MVAGFPCLRRLGCLNAGNGETGCIGHYFNIIVIA